MPFNTPFSLSPLLEHVILLPEVLDAFDKLKNRFFKPLTGLYEVLEFEAELELLDTQGVHALYRKRQKVRFLQDYIIAYQDQAWGDGEIFADYKCSPGVPVDTYHEGNFYRILISLRETKYRGDVTEFRIERSISNGFMNELQYFQSRFDHPTRKATLKVTFPKGYMPKEAALVLHSSSRIENAEAENLQTLPDQRIQVCYELENPRFHETYSIRWKW